MVEAENLHVALAGRRRPACTIGSTLLLLAVSAYAQAPVGASSWPHAVTLTIVTATGEPAPGAEVRLWLNDQSAGACRYSHIVDGHFITTAFEEPDPFPATTAPALSLQADAAGCLRLELPSEGAVFEASVGEGAASGLWYARALQHEDAVTVRVDPVGEIAGIVLSVGDAPIAGARVRFQEDIPHGIWDDESSGRGEPRRPRDAVSDGNGRFVVPAEYGFAGAMSALTPGGWTEVAFAHSSGRSPPPIRLREPGRFRIRGSCVDDEGRPLADAHVGAERGYQARIPEATSDAAGRFEIALVDPGWYWLTSRDLRRLDHVLDSVARVQVSEASPIADVTLSFVRAVSIRGRLQWADGRPVPGASISIPWDFEGMHFDRSRNAMASGGTQTAADGSFELRGLHPGRSFDLVASLSGDREPGKGRGVLADQLVHGVAAGTSDMQIVFTDTDVQGGRIDIAVRDAVTGALQQDAEAWTTLCFGDDFPYDVIRTRENQLVRNARREPGGQLVIEGLRHAMPLAILVSAPGHETTALGPIEPGLEPSKLDVALCPLASTRVIVVDDAGVPAARAWIWVLDPPTAPLRKDSHRRLRFVVADASGAAVIDVPAGQEFFVQAVVGRSTSDVVRVHSPTSPEAVVSLSLGEQMAGSLDTRVVDESGQPLAETEVLLTRRDVATESATALTDADGIAHFPTLQPGLWMARCADPDRGYGDEAVPVFAGQPATLVLPTR